MRGIMAVPGEHEPSGFFEQLVGEWRASIEGKNPNDYTPTDWRIIGLLQLRRAWLTHAQDIANRHPLAVDPTLRRQGAGLRPVDPLTDSPDSFSNNHPSQN